MLKISVVDSSPQTVTLRLEGQVIGPWVGELRQVCERFLTRDDHLTLDFTDVSFIDRNGLAFCRSLQERHVIFTHCSAFVTEQLKG